MPEPILLNEKMVFCEITWPELENAVWEIPITEAEAAVPIFAPELVKSRTVFPVAENIPPDDPGKDKPTT